MTAPVRDLRESAADPCIPTRDFRDVARWERPGAIRPGVAYEYSVATGEYMLPRQGLLGRLRELLGDGRAAAGEFVADLVLSIVFVIGWLVFAGAASAAFWIGLSYLLMLALWAFGIGDLHWFPEILIVPDNRCDPAHASPC